MESGGAVLLHLAATLTDPAYDLTFVLYDNEEVEADRSGLKRLVETRRELLQADLSVLMEPTDGAGAGGRPGTPPARRRGAAPARPCAWGGRPGRSGPAARAPCGSA